MKRSLQNIIDFLIRDLIFSAVLVLSLLFFFYKGVLYLLLGSYIPFILISSMIVLFFLSSEKNVKSFKRVTGLWAILIIMWSIVRIVLSLVNQFIKPISESHVSEQLGILGLMQSLIFLIGAIYLWKYRTRVFEK
ncbi:MAG: hypothetical protein GYB35_06540 [Algicola sp.]|nr:hypothetical protein [Algicola sp.]